MRILGYWIGYLILVFVGGAAVAPWLYHGTQWLGHHVSFLSGLADHPFHRFVHRSIFIVAFLGLVPLTRHLGLRSWEAVGFRFQRGAYDRFNSGWVAGFVTVGIVMLVILQIGPATYRRSFEPTLFSILSLALKAVLTGVTVGILEELLFRGIVFGSLRGALGVLPAMVVSSAIYSWVHFFAKVSWVGPVSWDSGFQVVRLMIEGLVDPYLLWPAALNLFVAGMILVWLYHRTGDLATSIGLHAGWVIALKLCTGIFKLRGLPGSWTGSSRLVDGWIALPALLFSGWFAWKWVQMQKGTEPKPSLNASPTGTESGEPSASTPPVTHSEGFSRPRELNPAASKDSNHEDSSSSVG